MNYGSKSSDWLSSFKKRVRKKKNRFLKTKIYN